MSNNNRVNNRKGNEMKMKVRTLEGAIKRYNAILAEYKRRYAGGGMFGFDWPTLRMNEPETYLKMKILKRLMVILPSRNN